MKLIGGTSISLGLGFQNTSLSIIVFLKKFFWSRRRTTPSDCDDLKEPIFRGHGCV